ncbi:Leucine-rich repeat-containing protein sog2 [Neolecta irregularis DAH-3]|uniref:Leucine-rich repeat-containing protein sog2 n=1 Tax=Neolecta irregularis (strain DAH-3) TaxID=1198029 RepID=A0A1U7LT88_NEOID|nr:Leucine-rich repeat-containing protein sog2 [Neolecta irregularis DAH-3]|eukprot:OLL25731.1 Leucine-rich repeat-containing protein sog2 [Neolecta irregularis DAH-3]
MPLPPPIDTAGILALLAEAQNKSQDGGVTVDLSGRISGHRIAELPNEVIDTIKTQVQRLALSHNQLTTLPASVSKLSHLRYINVRSNRFKVFPDVLCSCVSLEILDISRNKLQSLPRDFGNLINLKVLSISKNYIKALPVYIAQMDKLNTLAIDHNPIIFPPKDIISPEGGENEIGKERWLLNIKQFLRSHKEKFSMISDSELITSEDDADTDYFQTVDDLRRLPSIDASLSSLNSTPPRFFRPPFKKHLAPPLERSRSNHEVIRKPSSHQRGFSHDSIKEIATDNNSESYFRRFSRLPVARKNSLASIKLVEAARGILFSLSQIHQAIWQYTSISSAPTGTLSRVLYTASIHLGQLVSVLEAHDTGNFAVNTRKVREATVVCVAAFRQVVGIFQENIRGLMAAADVRYTRTLILLLYGAAVEVGNSWATLRESLPQHLHVSSAPNTKPSEMSTPTQNPPQLSTPKMSIDISSSGTWNLTPGSIGGPFGTEINGLSDDVLFEKLSTATSAALTALALLIEAANDPPPTPNVAIRLIDLRGMCVIAEGATRRLRARLSEKDKRKVMDETSGFVKSVISIAELAKNLSVEFAFSKTTLSSLSTVTRSTKDVAILLRGGSQPPLVPPPTIGTPGGTPIVNIMNGILGNSILSTPGVSSGPNGSMFG